MTREKITLAQLDSFFTQSSAARSTTRSEQGWGAEVIECLSRALRAVFPEMEGISPAKLLYMCAFAEAWPDAGARPAIIEKAPAADNESLSVQCTPIGG